MVLNRILIVKGPSFSGCERDGNGGDGTTAKPAGTVVTYDARPADLKIKGNATKIESQDHDPRGVSAAIVRDRDFLESLAAVREKDAGHCA